MPSGPGTVGAGAPSAHAVAQIQACAAWASHDCFSSHACVGRAIAKATIQHSTDSGAGLRFATVALAPERSEVDCRDTRGITEAGRSRVGARSPEIRQQRNRRRHRPGHRRDRRPGLARLHESRARATGSCRTEPETRRILRAGPSRGSACTRNARISGLLSGLVASSAPTPRVERPIRALQV